MPKGAKATKRARGTAAIRQGKSPDEIFEWLFARWCNDRMTEKQRQDLALELLPYVKAKRKSVDMTVDGDLNMTIKIGGKPQ